MSATIRTLDLALTMIALPIALALFIILLIPLLVTFGPRILFRQERVGPQGIFLHVKIRTMRDQPGSPGRSHLETGRIPLIGRILRRSHLDELPELLLILAGKESFVGPRPLAPDHNALVMSRERDSLRRGWTGYAQIYLRRKGVLPSRIQRRLDRQLAIDLSPGTYIRVLGATVGTLLRKPGHSDPGPTVRAYRKRLSKEEP